MGKQAATEPFAVQAEETMKINFWGTLNVMKKFTPMVKKNGRIVLVSSMSSWWAQTGFTPKMNEISREMNLVNRTITLDRVEELAQQFVSDCKAEKNAAVGWPMSAYGTSKLFVNCITRVYAAQAEKAGNGVLVNCCCPGYVKTDMSSHNPRAPKYPVDGCKTSLWLATLSETAEGPQGCILIDA